MNNADNQGLSDIFAQVGRPRVESTCEVSHRLSEWR